jgi:hypothetical protein
MVETEILKSEWVVPKGGNQWGFKLNEGAPESVKKKFAQFEAAQAAVNYMATHGDVKKTK